MPVDEELECRPQRLVMPLLLLNMGGEMVYILHQRLSAQSIAGEKANRVLVDVVSALLSEKFLKGLFIPQAVPGDEAIREICSSLAHSSIMCLNATSMGKLYDLMRMGVKYQLQRSSCPQQALRVTLNHIESLRDLALSPTVERLVDAAVDKVISVYGSLDNGAWLGLWQAMLKFFQGCRIKVSLFLQNNIQRMDATILWRPTGPIPKGSDLPGLVRYFEAGSVVNEVQLPTEAASGMEPAREEAFDPLSSLGLNFYECGQKLLKDGAGTRTKAVERALHALEVTYEQKRPRGSMQLKRGSSSESKGGERTAGSAAAEVNLLACLMGGGAEAKGQAAESKGGGGGRLKPFKLNLFTGDGMEGAASKEETLVIDFDLSAGATTSGAKMVEGWDDDDDDDDAGAKDRDDEDEDDLLALMDSAK